MKRDERLRSGEMVEDVPTGRIGVAVRPEGSGLVKVRFPTGDEVLLADNLREVKR